MLAFFEHFRFLLVILSLGLGGCNSFAPPGTPRVETMPNQVTGVIAANKPDHRLPPQVSLCGEPFDLKRRSTYERLEFEFLRVVNHPAQVALWQRRAAQYFPYIEAELRAAGLPDDLKYLAVAESDLRPWISSPAGATGLWQFMPATARHYGLTVNSNIDHRQLPEPLMSAAARYMKILKNRFGSWSLAMAAYNAGEGRIGKAVASQGTSNYFDLDLPRETERYVYRIAAIKVVLENATAYGFNKTVPDGRYLPTKFVEKQITVEPGQSWPKLAAKLGCDYKTLRALNPHLLLTPPSGTVTLRLPSN